MSADVPATSEPMEGDVVHDTAAGDTAATAAAPATPEVRAAPSPPAGEVEAYEPPEGHGVTPATPPRGLSSSLPASPSNDTIDICNDNESADGGNALYMTMSAHKKNGGTPAPDGSVSDNYEATSPAPEGALHRQFSGGFDGNECNEPIDGVPRAPFTWNMVPKPGEEQEISVSCIDDVINAKQSNHTTLARHLNTVTALLYIMDTTLVFTIIGYWWINCDRDKWIAGGALATAAVSDWLMCLLGRLLRMQSVFFWPMTLKMIPFVPIFEIQWWLRARKEWRKEREREEELPGYAHSPHQHLTRFLHGFACMVCSMRLMVFTIPQMVLLILIHNATKDDEDVYTAALPTSLVIVAGVFKGLFCVCTIAYNAEVMRASRGSNTPLCCGIPTLGAFNNNPCTVVIGVLMFLGIYAAVLLLGLVTVDQGDCTDVLPVPDQSPADLLSAPVS